MTEQNILNLTAAEAVRHEKREETPIQSIDNKTYAKKSV